MYVIEVGKPYPGRVAPTEDGWQYNYRSGTHELFGFMDRPTMQETGEIRSGKLQLALFVEGDILLLALKFGEMPWADAVYSWHRVPAEQQTLPDPGDEGGEQRRLLQIVFMDRATRLVQVLRTVSLSPDFTAALHEAIRDQANRPWPGDDEYDQQLADVYRRYPTSKALVQDARARCVGGK